MGLLNRVCWWGEIKREKGSGKRVRGESRNGVLPLEFELLRSSSLLYTQGSYRFSIHQSFFFLNLRLVDSSFLRRFGRIQLFNRSGDSTSDLESGKRRWVSRVFYVYSSLHWVRLSRNPELSVPHFHDALCSLGLTKLTNWSFEDSDSS